jgi:hypothetical protein
MFHEINNSIINPTIIGSYQAIAMKGNSVNFFDTCMSPNSQGRTGKPKNTGSTWGRCIYTEGSPPYMVTLLNMMGTVNGFLFTPQSLFPLSPLLSNYCTPTIHKTALAH